MQPRNLTITLLLPLLLISFLACADKPTAPDTLTEEDVARIVAEELAKIDIEGMTKSVVAETLREPQRIAEIALVSTVYLQVKKTNEKVEYGTGFIINKDKIATAAHLLEDVEKGITAQRIGETKKHPIESILAIDKDHDLAIMQCKAISAPALAFADSDMVKIGQRVYVAGNPEKLVGTLSEGIISAVQPAGTSKWIKGKVIQITAPISAGSSGGPVLNERGEVIGVVLSSDLDGQNLNFAIPVNHLKALLKTIK